MNLLTRRVAHYLLESDFQGRLVIWGSGQVGDSLFHLVQEQFPQILVLGFVDSFATRVIGKGKYKIYPPEMLPRLSPDLIIIASIAFENEIYTAVKNQHLAISTKVYRISEKPETEAKFNLLTAQKDVKSVKKFLFEYPDNATAWLALGRLCNDGTMKALCQMCAAKLDKP